MRFGGKHKKDDELTPWKSFSSSVQQDNMIVIHTPPVFKYKSLNMHLCDGSFSFKELIRNSASAVPVCKKFWQ